MAIYKGKKCPNCGGTLLYGDNGYNVYCDSCGNEYKLSELTSENKENNGSVRKKTIDELESYENVLDTSKSWSYDNEELIEKSKIALKVAEYWKVTEFCSEILKREPENAEAYLYKMLADLKVPSREDLLNYDKDFVENKYYKIIQNLDAQGINDELNEARKRINENIKEAELNKKYTEAIEKYKNKNYYNAKKDFEQIIDYKDSRQYYESSMQIIDERNRNVEQRKKQEKTAKIVKKLSVIAAVALIIIICIVTIGSCAAKKRIAHDVSNIKIQITNKRSYFNENEYSQGVYYVEFTYNITNNMGVKFNYIEFKAHFKDSSGNDIVYVKSSFGAVSTTSTECLKLAPGSSISRKSTASCLATQYSYDTGFKYLYNNQLSSMTVTFETTGVYFDDGENYYVSEY